MDRIDEIILRDVFEGNKAYLTHWKSKHPVWYFGIRKSMKSYLKESVEGLEIKVTNH